MLSRKYRECKSPQSFKKALTVAPYATPKVLLFSGMLGRRSCLLNGSADPDSWLLYFDKPQSKNNPYAHSNGRSITSLPHHVHPRHRL